MMVERQARQCSIELQRRIRILRGFAVQKCYTVADLS